jgi:hypothetical protein
MINKIGVTQPACASRDDNDEGRIFEFYSGTSPQPPSLIIGIALRSS